jgi:hypothetical protein
MRDYDLSGANTRDLLTLFSRVMKQLRERKVVRSGNNPVGDYCESLVVRALKLRQLERSNKGCDAVDESGKTKYEIKGRRITEDNPSTQLSVIRDLDSCNFHYLVGVLLDEDFKVFYGCCIPHEVVKDFAPQRDYVNGRIIHLSPSLRKDPRVRDITLELTKAQNEWI